MTNTETPKPIVPFISQYSLSPGNRYSMRVSTSDAKDAIYLGRNVAFGCTCCGESSGLIWGYFFGNPNRDEIIVIPEQDIGSDEKGRVRADQGMLIREFTISASFKKIQEADSNARFFGHISAGSMQNMFKQAGLESKTN